MQYDEFSLPRGLAFARAAIAKVLADPMAGRDAAKVATERWGKNTAALHVLKAAVPGGGTGSGEWGAELAANTAATEFLDVVRPMTILGRLQGLRRVPVRTPFVAQPGGVTAYWRGQGKAAKASRASFTRETMVPLDVDALIVVSNDLLADSSPEAEALILNDMARAVAEACDVAFIDPANAGVAGVMPQSVTYNAIDLPGTGNLTDDMEAALGSFSGSLETAAWVLHPRLAASIGLRAGGRGVAADLGARGGTLAGLPALTSESVTLDSDGTGSLVLLDAAGIVVCDQGATTTRSNVAAIEMDDAPTGDSLTPTASSQSFVSLWQAESTALLVTRRINFKPARQSSVVVITNAGHTLAS
jgi:HK97 family phage major capsid protein